MSHHFYVTAGKFTLSIKENPIHNLMVFIAHHREYGVFDFDEFDYGQ